MQISGLVLSVTLSLTALFKHYISALPTDLLLLIASYSITSV